MQPDKIITPKTTGYTAVVCLGNAVVSGIVKNKTYRKTHKASAYIGAAITAVHIAQIEYYHSKFKNKENLATKSVNTLNINA